MRYILRALKYYITMAVVLVVVIFVMVKLGFVTGDINDMFVHGYDSLWQIALILLAFSAVYPMLGYGKRQASLFGSDEELKKGVVTAMEDRGYRLDKEDEADMSFVKRSAAERVLKLWEDRVNFRRTISGYEIEGRTKDIVRIISNLEYRFRNSGDLS